MRGLVFAAALLLCTIGGSALAATPEPIGPPALLDEGAAASVVVTPATPAASPVALQLKLPYPLICGRPSPGAIAITFPAGEKVPAQIASTTIVVPGARVKSVTVQGRTVTVAVALKLASGHVMCQTFSFGKLALNVTRAARLGNPTTAGTYVVKAKHGSSTYSASFRVGS
jgi:hypothetical protein